MSRSFLHYLHGSRGATTQQAQSPLSNDALFRVQSDVIRDLAERESCIILGRCADYILRDNPDRISLFLTADLADRQQRYADHDGITPAEALPLITRGDRQRADYYNYFTFKKWGDSSSYDLCIDSSKLGDDEMKVVEIIKNYMKTRGIL